MLWSSRSSVRFRFLSDRELTELPTLWSKASSRYGNGSRVRASANRISHLSLKNKRVFIGTMLVIAYHCFSLSNEVNAELRQPGLGHRSFPPNAWEYWPTMNAIVKLMPGLSPSKLDPVMTRELSKGSNNSYSPEATLAYPGPVEKCATIMLSTFCYIVSIQ